MEESDIFRFPEEREGEERLRGMTAEELIAAEVQKEIPEVKEVVLVNEVSPELLDFARKLLNHDHGAQDGLC